MASHTSRPPGGSKSSGSQRKAPKSKKLARTLEELESAFMDWEALGQTKSRVAPVVETRRPANVATKSEEEFRKKTKKLLNQLRAQLAELND